MKLSIDASIIVDDLMIFKTSRREQEFPSNFDSLILVQTLYFIIFYISTFASRGYKGKKLNCVRKRDIKCRI